MQAGKTGKYHVNVLKVGQCQVRGPEVYWMDAWDEWEELYFYMVLVHGEDRVVVINTGPPQDLTALSARWTATFGERGALIRSAGETPEAALSRMGVKPADVDFILVTPLQAYAVANIPLFCNARVGISRRGWIEDFHAPSYEMHVPRKLRIPDDLVSYLTIQAPEKVRLLGDEEVILPGLSAFWVGTPSLVDGVLDRNRSRARSSDGLLLQIRQHRAHAPSRDHGKPSGMHGRLTRVFEKKPTS